MTTIGVNEQIEIIKKAGKEACTSKANALAFLVDAGILEKNVASSSLQNVKVKKADTDKRAPAKKLR